MGTRTKQRKAIVGALVALLIAFTAIVGWAALPARAAADDNEWDWVWTDSLTSTGGAAGAAKTLDSNTSSDNYGNGWRLGTDGGMIQLGNWGNGWYLSELTASAPDTWAFSATLDFSNHNNGTPGIPSITSFALLMGAAGKPGDGYALHFRLYSDGMAVETERFTDYQGLNTIGKLKTPFDNTAANQKVDIIVFMRGGSLSVTAGRTVGVSVPWTKIVDGNTFFNGVTGGMYLVNNTGGGVSTGVQANIRLGNMRYSEDPSRNAPPTSVKNEAVGAFTAWQNEMADYVLPADKAAYAAACDAARTAIAGGAAPDAQKESVGNSYVKTVAELKTYYAGALGAYKAANDENVNASKTQGWADAYDNGVEAIDSAATAAGVLSAYNAAESAMAACLVTFADVIAAAQAELLAYKNEKEPLVLPGKSGDYATAYASGGAAIGAVLEGAGEAAVAQALADAKAALDALLCVSPSNHLYDFSAGLDGAPQSGDPGRVSRLTPYAGEGILTVADGLLKINGLSGYDGAGLKIIDAMPDTFGISFDADANLANPNIGLGLFVDNDGVTASNIKSRIQVAAEMKDGSLIIADMQSWTVRSQQPNVKNGSRITVTGKRSSNNYAVKMYANGVSLPVASYTYNLNSLPSGADRAGGIYLYVQAGGSAFRGSVDNLLVKTGSGSDAAPSGGVGYDAGVKYDWDFTSGLTSVAGNKTLTNAGFTVSGGKLAYTGAGAPDAAYATLPETDARYSASAAFDYGTGNTHYAGFAFGKTGAAPFGAYTLSLKGESSGKMYLVLEARFGAAEGATGTVVSKTEAAQSALYTLQVNVEGGRLNAFVNGVKLIDNAYLDRASASPLQIFAAGVAAAVSVDNVSYQGNVKTNYRHDAFTAIDTDFGESGIDAKLAEWFYINAADDNTALGSHSVVDEGEGKALKLTVGDENTGYRHRYSVRLADNYPLTTFTLEFRIKLITGGFTAAFRVPDDEGWNSSSCYGFSLTSNGYAKLCTFSPYREHGQSSQNPRLDAEGYLRVKIVVDATNGAAPGLVKVYFSDSAVPLMFQSDLPLRLTKGEIVLSVNNGESASDETEIHATSYIKDLKLTNAADDVYDPDFQKTVTVKDGQGATVNLRAVRYKVERNAGTLDDPNWTLVGEYEDTTSAAGKFTTRALRGTVRITLLSVGGYDTVVTPAIVLDVTFDDLNLVFTAADPNAQTGSQYGFTLVLKDTDGAYLGNVQIKLYAKGTDTEIEIAPTVNDDGSLSYYPVTGAVTVRAQKDGYWFDDVDVDESMSGENIDVTGHEGTRPVQPPPPTEGSEEKSNLPLILGLSIGIPVLAGGAAALALILKKRRKA